MDIPNAKPPSLTQETLDPSPFPLHLSDDSALSDYWNIYHDLLNVIISIQGFSETLAARICMCLQKFQTILEISANRLTFIAPSKNHEQQLLPFVEALKPSFSALFTGKLELKAIRQLVTIESRLHVLTIKRFLWLKEAFQQDHLKKGLSPTAALIQNYERLKKSLQSRLILRRLDTLFDSDTSANQARLTFLHETYQPIDQFFNPDNSLSSVLHTYLAKKSRAFTECLDTIIEKNKQQNQDIGYDSEEIKRLLVAHRRAQEAIYSIKYVENEIQKGGFWEHSEAIRDGHAKATPIIHTYFSNVAQKQFDQWKEFYSTRQPTAELKRSELLAIIRLYNTLLKTMNEWKHWMKRLQLGSHEAYDRYQCLLQTYDYSALFLKALCDALHSFKFELEEKDLTEEVNILETLHAIINTQYFSRDVSESDQQLIFLTYNRALQALGRQLLGSASHPPDQWVSLKKRYNRIAEKSNLASIEAPSTSITTLNLNSV